MPEVLVNGKKIFFDTYESTIEQIAAPAEDLRIVKFRLNKPISFAAGQYVSLSYPGVRPAPFSIASSPEQHETLELGIEIVGGPNTSRLKAAKPGDKVMLRGPFGNFVLDGQKKVCFIAGGTGIVPFLSMLRWIRDTNQEIDATLFYSCKAGKFLWLEELEQLAGERTRIVFTCTRNTPAHWQYLSGRIDERMVLQEMPDFAERTFFICGPREFIEAMFSVLKGMGVPENRLKREVW
jgi:ferredoxin-NADP reductase